MEPTIELKEILNADGEVDTIVLLDEHGNKIADLSRTSKENITEAENLDDYIDGLYVSEDTGSESRALFNLKGKLITKGISQVVEFIEPKNSFILSLNANEQEYREFKMHDPDDPDFLNCVIDYSGEFIIEPLKDEIEYFVSPDIYLIGRDLLFNEIGRLGRLAAANTHYENYLYFEKNGKFGIITKGNILMEARYAQIESTNVEGRFWVKEGDKWKVLQFTFNEDGSFTLETEETNLAQPPANQLWSSSIS